MKQQVLSGRKPHGHFLGSPRRAWALSWITKAGMGTFAHVLLRGACPELHTLIFRMNEVNHVHIEHLSRDWHGTHSERCKRLFTTQYALGQVHSDRCLEEEAQKLHTAS
jgi:hypothetical protein